MHKAKMKPAERSKKLQVDVHATYLISSNLPDSQSGRSQGHESCSAALLQLSRDQLQLFNCYDLKHYCVGGQPQGFALLTCKMFHDAAV